ncbi:hypothetical protein DFH94DRAFT_847284 [Russula ochroleuca]|uniref:Uncharacterized protein n=1 Tax=Russula ochroleuca TaxID=152965 RepID=A0A9P5MR66_9AGAM|nr:hypothetical protein DFH94DRAFT_849113 [Russula ochroleuca]KAF8471590.1 hypothetical protein DFH94DRAFT_847284 [Russula ochroleuca]
MPKGCLPPLFSVLVTASLATASGRARCKSQQRGDKGRAGKQISRVRDIKERWRVSRRNAFYARARSSYDFVVVWNQLVRLKHPGEGGLEGGRGNAWGNTSTCTNQCHHSRSVYKSSIKGPMATTNATAASPQLRDGAEGGRRAVGGGGREDANGPSGMVVAHQEDPSDSFRVREKWGDAQSKDIRDGSMRRWGSVNSWVDTLGNDVPGVR